jgi:hypothetical protein
MLHSHCTRTVLILYSYCTHTVLTILTMSSLCTPGIVYFHLGEHHTAIQVRWCVLRHHHRTHHTPYSSHTLNTHTYSHCAMWSAAARYRQVSSMRLEVHTTILILYSYCMHTVLILYSYCTRTISYCTRVLISCTHTVLIMTHTVLPLYSYPVLRLLSADTHGANG